MLFYICDMNYAGAAAPADFRGLKGEYNRPLIKNILHGHSIIVSNLKSALSDEKCGIFSVWNALKKYLSNLVFSQKARINVRHDGPIRGVRMHRRRGSSWPQHPTSSYASAAGIYQMPQPKPVGWPLRQVKP